MAAVYKRALSNSVGWNKELVFFLSTAVVWGIALVLYVEDVETMLMEYWPILFIALASSIVASATAVGGGFIFMPLFSLCYGFNPLIALKLALATQAFGMSSGALSWPRQLIIWRYVFFACVSSGVGMVLGTFLWIPSSTHINLFFGWVSLILGCLLIKELLHFKEEKKDPLSIGTLQLLSFIVLCVVGGLINAWVSIGIGELVAVWLIIQLRHNVASAVATGVVTLAFCSILGLLFHSALGGIPWHYLLFTAPGVVLGGRIGAKLGYKLSAISSMPNSIKLKIPPLKAIVAMVIIVDGIVVLLSHPAL